MGYYSILLYCYTVIVIFYIPYTIDSVLEQGNHRWFAYADRVMRVMGLAISLYHHIPYLVVHKEALIFFYPTIYNH